MFIVGTFFVIGAFYYVLGNIKPQKRSRLSRIQLLLLAKYQTISEFGIDKILEPIINDIKKLESVSKALDMCLLYCYSVHVFKLIKLFVA